MSRRVVITGMGAITPIGNDVNTFWENAKKGVVGIGPITKLDTTDYKAKLAGEVKDFVVPECVDKKAARRMEDFSKYAVAAAVEAIGDSGLELEKEDPYRVGVCVGSGVGSLQNITRNYVRLLEKGPNRVEPLMIPGLISNIAAGNIAIQFGLKGKNINVVTACATGNHNIGEGFRSILYGEADVMVTGGGENTICDIGLAGFMGLNALSTSEDPKTASRPFDVDRDGFVMAEGAGILVLEELEHAKARGAHIYAEIAGYGATSDAYHVTAPAEDGSGAAKAMEFAMKDAEVSPEEVDYINAHGTSTHMNDLFETRAVRLALGAAADKVKVNSTKSLVGHMLGAAGGVEAIACIKSINDNFIHVNAGLVNQDPECDLDVVKGEGISHEVNVVISNSLGFGGHNASLVFKAYN
ncbi:MAG: beta-ketoacyl-ACP synthase II [Eubacterium sp.]|nr:beta-ketoacyl-ACP synthase II [Eubacterium sp.]